jgi:hypothetical protein
MKEKTYNIRKGVWVGKIESGVEKKREVKHVRMNCMEKGINKYTNGHPPLSTNGCIFHVKLGNL